MPEPRVYSKRAGAEPAPEGAVYVGRPTIWGNPFSISATCTREQALEKYREWIYSPNKVLLRDHARRSLRGKDLVCWCHPLPCHADVLLEIANG